MNKIRGLLCLSNPDQILPSSVYSNPHVDGIAQRVRWKTLEPTEGAFNWTIIDKVLAPGKPVTFSIQTGVDTPNWVYAAGCQRFDFVDSKTQATMAVPVPWDHVYQSKLEAFWTAFAACYGGNHLVTVKLDEVCTTTEELRLPYYTNPTVDIPHWQKLGYTRNKMKYAWKALVDAQFRHLPNCQAAPMVLLRAFPPIDDSGKNTGKVYDRTLVAELIQLGISVYGPVFAVQNNGLSAHSIDPLVAGVRNQADTGYQMVWWTTGQGYSNPRMNDGMHYIAAQEAGVLQEACLLGITYGAKWLEIYQQDVLNPALQPVLQETQAALKANQ